MAYFKSPNVTMPESPRRKPERKVPRVAKGGLLLMKEGEWHYPYEVGINRNHMKSLVSRGLVQSRGTQEVHEKKYYQYRITKAGLVEQQTKE